MSRICPITGKKPSTGNNVSHSQRKTKRRWLPNLVTKKVWINGQVKKVRISTKALRTLTKFTVEGAKKAANSNKQEKAA